MLPDTRRLGLLGVLAIGALLLPISAAQAEFVGSAISVHIWSGGGGTGNYELTLPIPTDPWGWELDAPVSIYDPGGNNLLATIDSLSVALDGDPAVTLNFAVTAGAAATLISVTSSTITFPDITDADAFATAALSLTDNNGNGASATGIFAGGKSYEARYNGGTLFAGLVDPVVAGAGSSALGTQRTPGVGTVVIPGETSSIQSQFSFLLSARDSASGTSRFQVNVPSPIIPEPSTWVLGSLALLGWVWLGRRRIRR